MSSLVGDCWISRFCQRRRNKFFCAVDKEFIRNTANLTGLFQQVPLYQEALSVILDLEQDVTYAETSYQYHLIQKGAELLYGLIHARFILTQIGVEKMIVKYRNNEFGHCPRVYCQRYPTLPIGLSDVPGECMVKLYCPKCVDVYNPKSSCYIDVDGAYFGTGFPHILLMVHPEYRPLEAGQPFEPRDFS